jgi:pimeloyl-ACP methyl ester carboxylesterase
MTIITTRRDALLAGAAIALTTTVSSAHSADAPAKKIKRWRHYADCRFGQIHMISAEPADGSGKGKTPLVCLHQSPTSGDYYREFQELMAQDRLVICPDTSGYGGSDHPAALPTMMDLGGAMAEAFVNMGYGKNAPGTTSKGALDWLGFHTGNYVITEVVAQRPDLVRRLIMPSIPYYAASERETKRKQYATPRPYFTDPDYVGRSFKEAVIDAKSPLPKERLLDFFVERLRAGPESWWGFDAVFRYDADPALAKITQDVLLPIMSLETLAEPTRQAGKLMSKAKSVSYIDLPGMNGNNWQTTPEKLVEALKPFLDKA